MSISQIESVLNATRQQRGPLLTALRESEWFARLPATIAARELADELVGFANAGGGVVVVGLTADAVEGTDRSWLNREALMQAGASLCEPRVKTRQYLLRCLNATAGDDHLLVIEVEPSDVVHTNARGEALLRVGRGSRRLSFLERQELEFDKREMRYEGRVCEQLGVGDLDSALVAEYCGVGGEDLTRLLNLRGLAAGDRLTIAGALLFAEHPEAEVGEAWVQVVRHVGGRRDGGVRMTPLHDERFDGPIPRQLAGAAARIRELLRAGRASKGDAQRQTAVARVPEEAWLEGLVNAVLHRSYSEGGDHVVVEIFDDGMEMWSPGRFLGLVSYRGDGGGVTRMQRNPRIARVRAERDPDRESGMARMVSAMRAGGLSDPIHREGGNAVKLTLMGEPVAMAADASLSSRGRRILATLSEAGGLSTGEVAEALGESRPVVQRELKALRDGRGVDWVGKSARDPHARWTLARGA